MIDDRELVVRALRRRIEAARREVPPTHSSVEEIVAYYEGEMPEERGRELQRHLILCRDCPDLLLDLDGFVHLPEANVEETPPELESVWHRLRRQLAAEGWLRRARPARPVRWTVRAHLIAAALVLLVASLGLLLVRGDPLREVETARQGLPQWEVAAAVRSEVPRIGDPGSAAGFTLVASPDGAWDSPEYQVDLARPGGGSAWSGSWRPPSSSAPFLLEVPRGALPAGEYLLRFTARPSGVVEERHFLLSYR